MRKKLAALLAAAMIASVMPMSVFADSTNRVDKVITVAKDATIKVADTPVLKVEMKDALTTDLSFYLNLKGAEWGSLDQADLNADGTANTDKEEDIAKALADLGYTNITLVYNDKTTGTPGDTTPATKSLKALKFEDSNGVEFEAYKENGTTMAIRKTFGDFGRYDEFLFPLVAKVTGDDATVEVRKHDTEVSNSEHIFAVSNAAKAKVVVADAPNFNRSTEIANITLEELYANSIIEGVSNQDERWFTLELRDTDFTFEISDAVIEGERAYRGHKQILVENTDIRLSKDRTRLGVRIDTIPAADYARERGNFVLKGVKVVADRDAKYGPVKATIESKELFDKDIITIATRGDYKTKLSVADDWKYEVVAGTEKEVTFKLSEELANSLVGERPLTFKFDQGVKIKSYDLTSSKDWANQAADDILWGNTNDSYRKKVLALKDIAVNDNAVNGTPNDYIGTAWELYTKQDALEELIVSSIQSPSYNTDDRPGQTAIYSGDVITITGKDVADEDAKKWSASEVAKRVTIAKDFESFTVDHLNMKKDKAGNYTFTTTLLVPASVTGDIQVSVEGRGVDAEAIKILTAEAPVTVKTTPIDIKVGLKGIETTGKVTITETAKERINQGKDIVIGLDDQDRGLAIKSFKATVVEGDLVLEDRREDDLNIRVRRSSTEPSVIEITDIVMTTDRTVPEGKYDLLVGGNAISSITGRPELYKNKHYGFDPVAAVKGFVNITTKNTEDIAGAGNKAEVSFTVGSTDYLINGKTGTMDAPAYIKDSNTMVSFRYVAQALGVSEEQVTWDGATQTATVLADKVLQVKLGSKTMNVNGVSIPMTASAELVNDRTFVPMGAIARALGVEVVWDNDTKTATFNPAK